MRKHFFTFYFLLFTFYLSPAQEIKPIAKLDTNKILIGDHIKLLLQIEHAKNIKVLFPQLTDTANKLEIIDKSQIDTVKGQETKDEGRVIEKQTYTITYFDSGFFVIPPLSFSYTKEHDTTHYTAETEPLLITVQSLAVDTTKAIKDIKPPLEVGLSWREIVPYIFGVLLLASVVFAIYYYFKKRKKPVDEIVKKIPTRPAYEIALEALKALENEKLWQQGNVKLYYIKLSDIVRTYIEHRFQIIAMELTTDEILEQFRGHLIGSELKIKLKQLLELSDLVKFAKMQPLPNEHDLCMKSAYDFVKLTMVQETVESN